MSTLNVSLHWHYDLANFTVFRGDPQASFVVKPGKTGYDAEVDRQRKADVYEDRVQELFLAPARQLDRNHNYGFVVLMVCLAYVEGVEQYRSGRSADSASQAFFIRSADRIFGPHSVGGTQSDWSLVYEAARCGLFHQGMTKGQFSWTPKTLDLTNPDQLAPWRGAAPSPAWLGVENSHQHAIEFTTVAGRREAILSPKKILQIVDQDFQAYVTHLRSQSIRDPLVSNFCNYFCWPQ